MPAPRDHDEYIASAPEQFRPSLAKLRAAVTAAMPDAEEVIAHNMPGFKIGDSIVIGYAAFSKQCGLYLPAGAIAACADALAGAGIKTSKTGVTFTPAKPLPDELLAQLIEATRRNLSA